MLTSVCSFMQACQHENLPVNQAKNEKLTNRTSAKMNNARNSIFKTRLACISSCLVCFSLRLLFIVMIYIKFNKTSKLSLLCCSKYTN